MKFKVTWLDRLSSNLNWKVSNINTPLSTLNYGPMKMDTHTCLLHLTLLCVLIIHIDQQKLCKSNT